MLKIQVETSGRHIHLSQKDLDILFGKKYKLQALRRLSQPDQFAAKETVVVIGSAGKLKLRIVGPVRAKTQVEVSRTDSIFLGINAPLKLSGDLTGAGKIKIIGLQGNINRSALIVAERHVHVSPELALKNKLKNGQKVAVKIRGERSVILQNIIVRFSPNSPLVLHLDTDESNAASVLINTRGELLAG